MALGLVSWYRGRVSPLSPPCCRYYPTCSTYALTAIGRFGALRGGALALMRLLRCRPWSDGGIDDVPSRFSIFYRFRWSKAHEEQRLEPLAASGPARETSASHKETI
ncbi:membrane protein insertion efficiency factor YidD [Bifidobacterium xylocopae]|uniref:Putative membrane protein insertion efficiency factor n=1 Tax=Bifidobacterium xylocopae TaxID=2493119 RepID=A0A366KF24_9BIFI|nr:membrane protein insertion efficiency factor YidD [Bifidobacterium xylocopae]RBP99713.1 membrane protein insertion efficiency factor YidD [Bifidobacterium xylocopae]